MVGETEAKTKDWAKTDVVVALNKGGRGDSFSPFPPPAAGAGL